MFMYYKSCSFLVLGKSCALKHPSSHYCIVQTRVSKRESSSTSCEGLIWTGLVHFHSSASDPLGLQWNNLQKEEGGKGEEYMCKCLKCNTPLSFKSFHFHNSWGKVEAHRPDNWFVYQPLCSYMIYATLQAKWGKSCWREVGKKPFSAKEQQSRTGLQQGRPLTNTEERNEHPKHT